MGGYMLNSKFSVHNNYRVASDMIFNQIVIIHEVITLGRKNVIKLFVLCINLFQQILWLRKVVLYRGNNKENLLLKFASM